MAFSKSLQGAPPLKSGTRQALSSQLSTSAFEDNGGPETLLSTVKSRSEIEVYMRLSINGGAPKSSILMGFSIRNPPFGGTPIYGNPHMVLVGKTSINDGFSICHV